MESIQGKITSLQESLRSLNLQANCDPGSFNVTNILLGKVLTSRSLRKYTFTEIICKSWKVKLRIQIEKIEENCFKFIFRNKEDQEYIFRNRPWSINGAHLILKEWPNQKALQEIKFDTSTFFIQIHGLPPAYLNEDTPRILGSKLGAVHQNSINKKCVVGCRYLRLRVEINVENLLLASFFFDREDGNDFWVQFKFEKLADFCYICGMIDHVTGRCKFKDYTLVTSPNSILAKLFGLWLRDENNISLNFRINYITGT